MMRRHFLSRRAMLRLFNCGLKNVPSLYICIQLSLVVQVLTRIAWRTDPASATIQRKHHYRAETSETRRRKEDEVERLALFRNLVGYPRKYPNALHRQHLDRRPFIKWETHPMTDLNVDSTRMMPWNAVYAGSTLGFHHCARGKSFFFFDHKIRLAGLWLICLPKDCVFDMVVLLTVIYLRVLFSSVLIGRASRFSPPLQTKRQLRSCPDTLDFFQVFFFLIL